MEGGTSGQHGKCTQAYCFKCERKRKCYRFKGWVANDRNTRIIADSTKYWLCQECAYKVQGQVYIDQLIKMGFLTAWKPSTPIVTEQLTMEGLDSAKE